MSEETKNELTKLLFYGNIAGARNVRYETRLMALHNDIGCLIEGAEATMSAEMVEKTRLPDRC